MKFKLLLLASLWALSSTTSSRAATTLGTAFTYQGLLTDGGPPANGFYDLRFGLFTTNNGPGQVGPLLTNTFTVVSNGLFTVTLDFGANIFNGTAYWVELGARTYGSAGDFTNLSPRLPLLPSPYALYAPAAGVANGVGANAVGAAGIQDGVITAGKIAGSQLVKSLNGLFDNVTLLAGPNISLTTASANTIQISSTSDAGAWSLTGNTLTASGNFLGALNNQPLELRVNNTRALVLQPTPAGAPNVLGGSPYNQVDPGVVGATLSGGGAVVYPISGGTSQTNRIAADFGTIGGGYQNTILANNTPATIAGGSMNTVGIQASAATIGGGLGNTHQFGANSSTIGGGFQNIVQSNATECVIAGGRGNQVGANLFDSTVGGGLQNFIQPFASYGTIAGGTGNQVAGSGGTVPGGMFNYANGSLSFAAGNQAKANHAGAFVWADSTAADFASTAPNQFAVRAAGGVLFSDSTPSLSFGSTTRQMINLWGTSYGLGVQAYTTYFRCDGFAPGFDGFAWYQGGTHNDNRRNAGGGVELMYLNNAGLTVNGTFLSASDRNLKTNFSTVDTREVLDKVAALPISAWHYRNDPQTKHLGPVAQDFYATFGIGPDERHIATVDESGVALAAIQGLNQKLEEQAAAHARALQEKEAEIRDLKRQVGELRTAWERLIANGSPPAK